MQILRVIFVAVGAMALLSSCWLSRPGMAAVVVRGKPRVGRR